MKWTAANLRLWLCAAAAFVFAAGLRLAAFPGVENSNDGFYHMRLAREGWEVFSAKTFPTLTLSLWTDTFSDKELLYHVLLSWVDKLRLLFGVADFPFHFQSLFFIALLTVAFACCVKALQIRNGWLLVLLLYPLTHIFLLRMLMLRPHTFSLTLLLGCVALYCIDWKRWNFLIAAGTGFLFAWSYSNPHFIYMAAGSFAVGCFLNGERKRAGMLLAGATVGLLAGYTLHPQCPNTFVNWVVQCVVVPRIMAQSETLVGLGEEARHGGLAFVGEMPFWAALCLANLLLVGYALWKRRDVFRNPALIAVAMMALVTALGTLRAFRLIEYSPALNLLAVGMLLEALRPKWFERHVSAVRGAKIAVAVFFFALCAALSVSGPVRVLPHTEVAAYIRRNVPAGTVIGNLNWSDFPGLYYLLPDYRFLCALDPTFGLAADPEKYVRIEAHSRMVLKKPFPPEAMAELIGTRLLYVSSSAVAHFLYENGYGKVLFQGTDGYLFALPE